jgi:hypothetical protein
VLLPANFAPILAEDRLILAPIDDSCLQGSRLVGGQCLSLSRVGMGVVWVLISVVCFCVCVYVCMYLGVCVCVDAHVYVIMYVYMYTKFLL